MDVHSIYVGIKTRLINELMDACTELRCIDLYLSRFINFYTKVIRIKEFYFKTVVSYTLLKNNLFLYR